MLFNGQLLVGLLVAGSSFMKKCIFISGNHTGNLKFNQKSLKSDLHIDTNEIGRNRHLYYQSVCFFFLSGIRRRGSTDKKLN